MKQLLMDRCTILSIVKISSVAYITNGQNVPDDLVIVTPEKIVDLIVGAE